MQNNHAKIIALVLTLNLATSVAYAQSISGSIGITCNSVVQPTLLINGGLVTPAQLEFERAGSAGILNNPIKTATQFVIKVTDTRGYDAGPATCGNGFDVVLQADTATEYFQSQSGTNENILSIGGGPNNCLTIQGTAWTSTPSDIGLFSIAVGDENSGLNSTNIQGAAQTELNYIGNALSAPLATVGESFLGELEITFAGDDINLDIPPGIPVDRYFKGMVLSLS